MRGLGDFKYLLTLYAKGGTGRATEKLGRIWAARRTLSGKEFLELGAMHQEQTAIFTIRRPGRWKIEAGLEVADSNGTRWQVCSVTPNQIYPTCIDLRCVSIGLEGGYGV